MSVLFPILGAGLRFFQGRAPASTSSPLPRSIAILIPAHNEERHLEGTLRSIQSAISVLHTLHPDIPVDILVGLDGCTDATASIVARYADVQAVPSAANQGKWKTLQSLTERATSDGIILVDAGTLWPDTLLTQMMDALARHPDAVALAPAYAPRQSGAVSRLLWATERALKSMESFAGGPISVHGATVAYDARALRAAFQSLEGTPWLNDDVVLPLTVRAREPKRSIVYPVGQVSDAGLVAGEVDYGRRRRMVQGNLQWVASLWPRVWRDNAVAAVIAARRVFRMLWAYWLCCGVVGMCLAQPALLWPAFAAGVLAFLLSGPLRQLGGAALASLLTPWYVIHPSTKERWL